LNTRARVLGALLFTSVFLQAQTAIASTLSPGVSEAQVAGTLARRGLPVRLGNDTFREPMIESHSGSARFYVYFYECNQTRTCQNIQFRAGYAARGRVDLAKVNDWSTRWRFGRMYLDPEGDVILDMDVEARQGLSEADLAAHLSRWLEVMREAETFIGWGR
jgi:hypothetical protein